MREFKKTEKRIRGKVENEAHRMLSEMTAGFEDKDNREREDCENTEDNQGSHVLSSTKNKLI